MSDTNFIPEPLQVIIEDFEFLEGQEKLMHLLDLSERLPDLPERLIGMQDKFEQVHECMSPVFIYAEMNGGTIEYYFDIPREAPTVRGYGMILKEGLKGLTPAEVSTVYPEFYLGMGLNAVISGQRLNGMGAILRYMKHLAKEKMG
ncbi:MAG: cysteine desulfuration protein SufE [Cellvibrionaceae bacterium]|jgi:cysteine desulfuration protein SufE